MRYRLATAFVAALAGCAVLAPTAGASLLNLTGPLVTRTGTEAVENGYIGVRDFEVGGSSGSSDTYFCDPGEGMSGYIVVGANADSNDRAWSVTNNADPGDASFPIRVWDYSLTKVTLRLAATCTNNTRIFGYKDPQEWEYGAYQDYWTSQLLGAGGQPQTPSNAAYGELIKRSLCWTTSNPGCPRVHLAAVHASAAGNRFALRNGTNKLALRFKHKGVRRPPAVYLASPRGCRAQRMPLSVVNGSGRLLLELRCRGLSRGASARVRVGKAIHRSFHLRKGTGTLRVHLDKPPGKVEPYAHLSYGRAGTPCKSIRHKLRMRSRTFDLRVRARCGKVARNATGDLYVGGLLTP